MRKLLAIGLTLLLTVAALAQDPSVDSALARVATTGHVNGPDQQMLRSLPWQGPHDDPLTPMVRWDTVLGHSICWAGQEPRGWGDVSGAYKLLVVNETDHFISHSCQGTVTETFYLFSLDGNGPLSRNIQ